MKAWLRWCSRAANLPCPWLFGYAFPVVTRPDVWMVTLHFCLFSLTHLRTRTTHIAPAFSCASVHPHTATHTPTHTRLFAFAAVIVATLVTKDIQLSKVETAKISMAVTAQEQANLAKRILSGDAGDEAGAGAGGSGATMCCVHRFSSCVLCCVSSFVCCVVCTRCPCVVVCVVPVSGSSSFLTCVLLCMFAL